jgi:hypothetical protein
VILGYSWVTVFHHDTAGGMFPHGTGRNREEVINYNEDDPEADRYSILDKMEKYRQKDGLFHIRLCYPTYSQLFPCNEWTQSSNFVEDSEITDFKAIEITFEKSYYNAEFAGLKKETGYYRSYIWSNGLHWWFGIGYGYSCSTCRWMTGAYGYGSVQVLDVYLAAGTINKYL